MVSAYLLSRRPAPSRPNSAPTPELPQRREFAESFRTDAVRYDRTWPPYPGALVKAVTCPRGAAGSRSR